MTHLYELTAQMQGLRNLIEEGELDAETLADTLDGLEGDLTVKADNLLAYVSNLGSDIAQIDDAIKRLNKRKQAIKNRQDSLREYLRYNMEQSGFDKITCPLFTITLRKPVDVCVIEAEDLIHDDFKAEVVTTKIDKAGIKKALQSGKSVPGARLEPGKRALMIT